MGMSDGNGSNSVASFSLKPMVVMQQDIISRPQKK